MGPEPISGAVVKLSGDLLAKLSSGDSAGLIPRLVVHGTGTGVVWGFNLHIQNAGKEAAYGLQLSVPWDVLQRNRSRESHMTEWWAQTQSPPYVGLRWLAEKLRIRPLAQWASVRGLMFTTKDVGLVLAPGESVEVYFGMAPTSGRSGPVDGIVWKPGEIVELTLRWWNGMPGRVRFWKRSSRLALAIHTATGREVCAHTYWGNVNQDEPEVVEVLPR